MIRFDVRLLAWISLSLMTGVGSRSATHPQARIPKARPGAVKGFTHTPWEMFPANGIGVVSPEPIPASPGEYVFRDAPAPGRPWGRAPDPATIRYARPASAAACEEATSYNYFRTTLNVPAGMDRSSVVFRLARVADVYRVTVNGKAVAHKPANGLAVPIGRALRPGRNAVMVVLASWCGEPRADGARFTDKGRGGALFARVQPPDRK